jgi:death-on-curing protein
VINFLPEEAIIEIHDILIEKYGGEPGLRDPSLLDSALHQPMLVVQFADTLPSLHLLAATYGYHLSENQPFFDGNKRIAAAAIIMFLDINGLEITASEDEFFDKMMDLANKRMDKRQLADWLKLVTVRQEGQSNE